MSHVSVSVLLEVAAERERSGVKVLKLQGGEAEEQVVEERWEMPVLLHG